ncbi:hypothetical protein ABZT26_35195 [Streptomyces sp. NPDC005395]|uniref:hypothetical protein n=1 Tax=Streptomyces sp. NPDC005395 TaxID=3157042 RepID=UPI0033BBF33C
MWTEDYRRKGARALGASGPGERGPFGEYGDDVDEDDEETYASGGIVSGPVVLDAAVQCDEPLVRLPPSSARLEEALRAMAQRRPLTRRVEAAMPALATPGPLTEQLAEALPAMSQPGPVTGRLAEALRIMSRRGPVVELTVPWLPRQDGDAEVVGGEDEHDARGDVEGP